MQHVSVALVLAITGLAIGLSSTAKVRYDHYHVYEVKPQSNEQLAVMKDLDGSTDSYIFLDAVHHINSAINVLVAPHSVPDFVNTLAKYSIDFKLVDTDAQARLDENNDEAQVANTKEESLDYSWDKYYKLNDTYNWLYSLEAEYPGVAMVFRAGETYEKRDILGIKISYGTGNKAIFLECGIHAREWIGPATCTYIANELLSKSNRQLHMVAKNFDWYIVPHANPDGYVYTHTTNRLWRKTRTPYGNNCFGADPNRNWGFHWNEVGASNKPCSETYAGPHAFSEIETKSLSEFIASLGKGNIFLYVSFHSYSQLLLYPYGHTSQLPANYKDLKRVYDAAIDAMSHRYGTKYTGGNIYNAIYPAAGASVDWAYGEQDIKYVFCYELRPSSISFWTGFQLPPRQIKPTAKETIDSLVAMIEEASKTI